MAVTDTTLRKKNGNKKNGFVGMNGTAAMTNVTNAANATYTKDDSSPILSAATASSSVVEKGGTGAEAWKSAITGKSTDPLPRDYATIDIWQGDKDAYDAFFGIRLPQSAAPEPLPPEELVPTPIKGEPKGKYVPPVEIPVPGDRTAEPVSDNPFDDPDFGKPGMTPVTEPVEDEIKPPDEKQKPDDKKPGDKKPGDKQPGDPGRPDYANPDNDRRVFDGGVEWYVDNQSRQYQVQWNPNTQTWDKSYRVGPAKTGPGAGGPSVIGEPRTVRDTSKRFGMETRATQLADAAFMKENWYTDEGSRQRIGQFFDELQWITRTERTPIIDPATGDIALDENGNPILEEREIQELTSESSLAYDYFTMKMQDAIDRASLGIQVGIAAGTITTQDGEERDTVEVVKENDRRSELLSEIAGVFIDPLDVRNIAENPDVVKKLNEGYTTATNILKQRLTEMTNQNKLAQQNLAIAFGKIGEGEDATTGFTGLEDPDVGGGAELARLQSEWESERERVRVLKVQADLAEKTKDEQAEAIKAEYSEAKSRATLIAEQASELAARNAIYFAGRDKGFLGTGTDKEGMDLANAQASWLVTELQMRKVERDLALSINEQLAIKEYFPDLEKEGFDTSQITTPRMLEFAERQMRLKGDAEAAANEIAARERIADTQKQAQLDVATAQTAAQERIATEAVSARQTLADAEIDAAQKLADAENLNQVTIANIQASTERFINNANLQAQAARVSQEQSTALILAAVQNPFNFRALLGQNPDAVPTAVQDSLRAAGVTVPAAAGMRQVTGQPLTFGTIARMSEAKRRQYAADLGVLGMSSEDLARLSGSITPGTEMMQTPMQVMYKQQGRG